MRTKNGAALLRGLIFFSCMFSFHISGQAAIDPTDGSVMVKMAQSLKVSSAWGWTTATDPCKWQNINCNNNNKVTNINIKDGGVTGSLPANFNDLSALESISFQTNNISGSLPTFKGLSNLQSAYLGNNLFSSVPADFFSGLTNLQVISIDENPFSPWSIPVEIKDLTSLQSFSAYNANIIGEIPAFLGDGTLPSLQTLRLSYNNLSGEIPTSFNGSTSLQVLMLNNQNDGAVSNLGGNIEALGSLTQLTQLWIHVNKFTGPIPEFVSTSLFDLQFRDNEFTGPIPDSLLSLSSLKNISLKNNALQGTYPSFKDGVHADINSSDTTNSFCLSSPGAACDSRINVLLSFAGAVGYPYEFATSWKGNDPCVSWQGVSCANNNITVLNFPGKQLTGSISPALSYLTSVESIILNNNELTGSIPEGLARLPNLKKLDVTNNSLSGTIPLFPSTVQFLKDGNPKLGISSPPDSGSPDGANVTKGTAGNGTDTVSQGSKSKSNLGLIAGAVVGVVAAICIIGTICWFVMKRCRQGSNRVQSPNTVVIHPPRTGSSDRELLKITIAPNGTSTAAGSEVHSRTSSGPSGSDLHVVEAGSMVISIQVLRDVTDNFSENNVLGRGGFGVVYKGELHDGTKIAVKRMEGGVVSSKGLNEFQAEIAVLTKVRHRHLVALLGYCVDGNEKLLVYEYMPQGPLSQHLFDWAQTGLPPLDWKQRLTIALDVARGVEYLHSLAQKSFIHRDLKPSNILLGDDMRAKVSDFGLVKLAPEGKYSVETKLAGTFGYLAPEYAVTGRVTTKVDVFSFGVVLMELITGRRALDETQPEESMHLVTWFRRVYLSRDTFRKAIDPMLGEITDDTFQNICTVAELAGHCTVREPSQRPDMGHAVNVLSPLVEQWKPIDIDGDDCYGIDLDMTLPQALRKWQAFEGSSIMDDDSLRSLDNTMASIPNKPMGFAESFTSADCR
ncbi:receptor protein kinase TMK1 [Cryptomeria japonica]|uniref:receptor protein kinase TMK1 n=1 Tax=Cryptomeria japonica TaxID=3369 RepID=UPI0027DAA662|nr:receptor protein kinase TMK1 [Cryptomeria japonica]XP_059073996.1 receptor protein kinase TMK1 [Cryptomeria japonica]